MNKIYFQGTFGAYSHLAALSIFKDAEIIPCKTFDECFLKASKDDNSKIIIPESNRITWNNFSIFKN
jgi:prephenate dehydratase